MATKSKVAKKTLVKRSSPVKKVAKKAAAKKVAKPASPKGKKATVKKAAPKKAAVKKPVAKKAVAKKSTPKKVAVKPASPAGRKAAAKPAAKKAASRSKASVKTKPVSAASTPAMAELSEEMHEKAVHNEKESHSMMESGQGAKILERKEDPIMAFDMHMAQKATSKGDSNNKLRASTGQRPIRPSGKKPLWRK